MDRCRATNLWQRLLRGIGPYGAVWRARDRLERTLADIPAEQRIAFRDVLPSLDAMLEGELPRLSEEAAFLRRYLSRIDVEELKGEVRRWERGVYSADEPELREVRQRNLDLAREQLTRVERLSQVLQRYHDQVAGMALAIDEAAGRVAASRIAGEADVELQLERLREDIDGLIRELAEIGAEL